MDVIEEVLRRTLAERYAVEREIGRGGMALVFRAEDRKLGRAVAIKAFRPAVADPVATARFLQEIRTVATLAHPNILPLHDSGEVEGVLFFVTPFVDGETLRARLDRVGQVAPVEAARVGAAVARALHHAHLRGVIHRDVKPENILLQDDEPLLADFGIAFPMAQGGGRSDRITGTDLRLGTPAYMSPEQAAGGEVDRRSDLYALGIVLYELVGGRPPFVGSTPQAILAAQVSATPPPLEPLCPDAPPWLVEVIARALEKDPAARWPDAAALANALATETPARRRLRWPWIAAASLTPLALVAAAWRFLGPAPPRGVPQAIVLAEFAAPGGAGGLGRTVRELVSVALAQSRSVVPLAPDMLTAVRRAAGLSDTVQMSVVVSRQLAERAGVGAVVTGEVLRNGAGFTLVLRAVRARDGADLVSVTGHAADESELIAAAERAARELRTGLGERQGDIMSTRPLLDVATPSFPAFQKYADALERSRVGDPGGSNVLLREAVAIDTGFSSAWALMAVNFMDSRQLDSAAAAVAEALAHPARLTDAQRYRLQAEAAYTLAADPASAIRWYDLYLQEVPGSSGGRNNRALYLTMLGRWKEARPEFLRAAAEDPRGPAAAPMMRLNALATAVALGHLEDAEREARALDGPFRRYADLLVGAALDKWTTVGPEAAAVAADPGAPAWLRMQGVVSQASAEAVGGRPEEADRILADASSGSQGVASRWYGQARLLLALARGAPVPELLGDTTPGGWVLAGTSAGWRGDAVRARDALRRLTALDSLRRRRLGNGITLVRAAVEVAEGRAAAGGDILQAPAQAGELDGFALDRPSSDLLRWAAARARLQVHDTAGARAMLSLLRSSTSLPPNQVALRGLSTPYALDFLRHHP